MRSSQIPAATIIDDARASRGAPQVAAEWKEEWGRGMAALGLGTLDSPQRDDARVGGASGFHLFTVAMTGHAEERGSTTAAKAVQSLLS